MKGVGFIMPESHEKIREDLMDVYYGEKEMTADLKKHVETCMECEEFWQQITAAGMELSKLDIEVEIDERIIRNSFRKADRIMLKKKNFREFIAFVVFAAAILSTAGWLAYIGYGMAILKLQIGLMVFAPFMVPVLIRRRLLKEEG